MKSRIALLALLSFVLAGCQAVLVKAPAGDQPAVIEVEKWQGKWSAGDGSTMTVRVTDAEAGRLEAAWIEEEDLSVTRINIVLRSSGATLFINAQDEDQEKEGLWSWGVAANEDGDRIIAWGPDFDAFVAMAQSGDRKGVSNPDEYTVVLDSLPAEVQESITNGNADYLNWRNPLVLHRLCD